MTSFDFTHKFAINGVWIYPPDGYQMEPIPVVGYDMTGRPIRQGYPVLTVTWTFMRQLHFTSLYSVYNPDVPQVQLTYIDERVGFAGEVAGSPLRTVSAMMHEPVVGARQTIYYNNVGVRFSHLRAL